MTVRSYDSLYNPYRTSTEPLELTLEEIRYGLERFLTNSPIVDLIPGATGVNQSENPSINALNDFGMDVCDALNEDVILDLYSFLATVTNEVDAGEIHYDEDTLETIDLLLDEALDNTVFIQASGMGDDRALALAVLELVECLSTLSANFEDDEIEEDDEDEEEIEVNICVVAEV